MLTKSAKNLLEEVNKLKDLPKEEAYPMLDVTFHSYIHTVEDTLYYSRKSNYYLLLLLDTIINSLPNFDSEIKKKSKYALEESSENLKRDYEE
jgi:hypothetical protein